MTVLLLARQRGFYSNSEGYCLTIRLLIGYDNKAEGREESVHQHFDIIPTQTTEAIVCAGMM